MSTGLVMMLKSLGIDPKMLESVAMAVQSAANDLKAIKEQQALILETQKEIFKKLDSKWTPYKPDEVEKVNGSY
jgi:hypothetical protein